MVNKFFIGLILATLIASCTNQPKAPAEPTVVVSIAPQKFFVEQIADTLVNVEVMVSAGSSPETYEPTALQLKQLSKSKAYFSLGLLEFELSMLKNIEQQNPNLLVVNHSTDLSLLEGTCNHDHHHGHSHKHTHSYDPHVWTSPAEVKTMIGTITEVLSKQWPQHASTFTANSNEFANKIDSLNAYISHALANTQTKKFFVFHPALTYFARDYGLTQIALEEDGKSPSMQHFKTVLATAKEQGVKTIFIQREFDANTAKTAAADIGGRVEVINPLEEDWLNNMYNITKMLQKALNGE